MLSHSKFWVGIALLLLMLGFADAVYLTLSHYAGANLKCVISEGCDVVTTSKFATIGPVPISLIGTVYYATGVVLMYLFYQLDSKRILRLALWLEGTATAVSAVLVYLQLFVIEAICVYCVTSAILTASAFLTLLIINKINLRREIV